MTLERRKLQEIRQRDASMPPNLPGHYTGPLDRRYLLGRLEDSETLLADLAELLFKPGTICCSRGPQRDALRDRFQEWQTQHKP